MNLFGVGNFELIAILLVALLVLGPGRMVEVARVMGKFWRDAQRTLRSAIDASTVKLDEPISQKLPRDPVPAPEDAVAREGTPTVPERTEGGASNSSDEERGTRG